MNLILIAFVSGTTLFHFFDHQPSIGWVSLLLLSPWLWRYQQMRPVIALVAGVCWSLLYATLQLSYQLPHVLEGKDLLAEGVIDSLPKRQGRTQRFQFQLNRLTDPSGQEVDLKRIRLSWYESDQSVEPGEHWRFKVRLKRPRGMQNPAGFDYERWLFTQGIEARGYIRDGDEAVRLSKADGILNLDRLRAAIATRLDSLIDDRQSAAVIKALTIGDRRGLESEDWQIFTRTGTNHLIAISGLHVGLVAGWLMFLGQWFWRRSERLTLRLPALRAGALIGLIGAIVYAALSGFALPTQRALVMLFVALGGIALGREISHLRSLTLALFLVVLIDPFASMMAGFWLSFGAVVLILLAVDGRIARTTGWRQMVKIQASITLGLMPLLFIFFGEASILAPLVNLLLVPWFAIALVPLSLIGLPLLPIAGLAEGSYSIVEFLMSHTLELLAWVSDSSLTTLQLAHLPTLVWLFAMLGTLVLLAPQGVPGRALGLILILPVALMEPERPDEGEIWFTLLDVGQGLACVIETADHLLLYDTGPAYASGFSTAEAAVLPYLRAGNWPQVDLLVVSNGDSDHAGGVKTILQAMPVSQVVSGEGLNFAHARFCQAGESWSWDGVEFMFLHPQSDQAYTKPNDRSCVLKVSNGDWSLLIPGDIEARAERQLVAGQAEHLKSQIVVAPHHGSKTSSGTAFIHATEAEWVLFSVGYRNRYGFPKSEVVDRWRSHGATPISSDASGAIQFRLTRDSQNVEPVLFREENLRYWNH